MPRSSGPGPVSLQSTRPASRPSGSSRKPTALTWNPMTIPGAPQAANQIQPDLFTGRTSLWRLSEGPLLELLAEAPHHGVLLPRRVIELRAQALDHLVGPLVRAQDQVAQVRDAHV